MKISLLVSEVDVVEISSSDLDVDVSDVGNATSALWLGSLERGGGLGALERDGL